MRKAFYFFTVLLILLLNSCNSKKYNNLEEGLYAEIKTNKGDILIELYATDVPKTVANFVGLVEGTNSQLADSLKGNNFYENNIFHRVVPNFVIQAGGFTSTGRKHPGYLFGDEFPKNNLDALIYKHNDQGILSMANGGPNTNNSQFFITHRAIPHLNGKHSVFGKTIVNSVVLKQLQEKFKDSLQIQQAIDSARMAVVHKIAENDTIITIDIIRLGAAAKSFDAKAVFDQETFKYQKLQEVKIKEEKRIEEKRYSKYLEAKKVFFKEKNESKAKETGTGLRILKLKNTNGKKVIAYKTVVANYTLYLADGKKIKSSKESGGAVVFNLENQKEPMISGLKEGVLTMREGEKARFFIPYYIGFGAKKFGIFPAKSDLVFEVEILKVGT